MLIQNRGYIAPDMHTAVCAVGEAAVFLKNILTDDRVFLFLEPLKELFSRAHSLVGLAGKIKADGHHTAYERSTSPVTECFSDSTGKTGGESQKLLFRQTAS